MNNENSNLNKAWKVLSSTLSFDTDLLSEKFRMALDFESKTISVNEFNSVLLVFSAMNKDSEIPELIERYIDENLGNEEFYISEIDNNIKWNEDLIFKVNILRKLHKKSSSRKINEFISSHLLTKENKEYLTNVSKEDWMDYISNSTGLSLKNAIKTINSRDIKNGKEVLLKLKSKCNLTKIAIEIMEAA